MRYEPVIGLEVHAELATRSKMFCACPVVDSTQAEPNTAVCPVCAGMPGTLPVANRQAVELGLRVALALGCRVNPVSIFARKNYFYPDLPKGYQISQYEQPLAEGGALVIDTPAGERTIRIRRVHLEEDTGKLTHVQTSPPAPPLKGEGRSLPPEPLLGGEGRSLPPEPLLGGEGRSLPPEPLLGGEGRSLPPEPLLGGEERASPPSPLQGEGRGDGGYSLVDLNRAGVPLLEIVSEPDLHTLDEVRAYATGLRAILRALGASSGDMEKGAIRFEANVSLRPEGSDELGTRVEIKNLNSFRFMERALAYEIERQAAVLEAGGKVEQETVGWDEAAGCTFSQRSKEEAHDYRYFPEPDLPPLVISPEWQAQAAASLPELPRARQKRFESQYGLAPSMAALLSEELPVAAYFERAAAAAAAQGVAPATVANWLSGEVFAWLNLGGARFEDLRLAPEALADLLIRLQGGEVNMTTAKAVLAEMLESGREAGEIIAARGLRQVSDAELIAGLVRQVLEANPREVASYRAGKLTLANWFFGQVMKVAAGKANPQVVRAELERQLRG